jgi:glutathione S-transferase
MKLYGHYASQPARSVLWLLKMNNIPFEFIKTEPLAGSTRKPEYLAKFPTAMIPAIDDEGFCLAECSAILQYICEKHKLEQFWSLNPSDIKKRSKISEYLSYHGSIRKLSGSLAFPVFKQKFFKKPWDPVEKEKSIEKGIEILKDFQRIFLKDTSSPSYINGIEHPTIADLQAYPEIAQLEQLKVMDIDKDAFPLLRGWLDRLSQLPEHDDIHQTVIKIGNM